MAEFKIRQIVYSSKGDWVNGNNISLFNPPKVGQLMVIDGITMYKDRLMLHFSHQPKNVWYPAKHFRPRHCLFADNVIANLIKQTA